MASSGRPTEFKEAYVSQAYELALLGLTDKEMGDVFGVNERTINRWKKKHPGFCQSLKDGKQSADAKVAAKLHERACGYTTVEQRIVKQNGEDVVLEAKKEYPPDTAAAIIWLKNRQPSRWRDRPEPDEGDSSATPVKIEIAVVDGRANTDPTTS